MDKIKIAGIDAYDGEYDIDVSVLTNRDLHTIKRISGVRAGELQDAMEAADADLIVAFTVIALQRHGKPVIEDILWDAPAGKITYVGEPAEADPVEGSPSTPPALPSIDGVKPASDSETSEAISESPVTIP